MIFMEGCFLVGLTKFGNLMVCFSFLRRGPSNFSCPNFNLHNRHCSILHDTLVFGSASKNDGKGGRGSKTVDFETTQFMDGPLYFRTSVIAYDSATKIFDHFRPFATFSTDHKIASISITGPALIDKISTCFWISQYVLEIHIKKI